MKRFMKKGLSGFLGLAMIMSLFGGVPQKAYAATAAPDPTNNKVTSSSLTPHVGDVVHLTAIGDREDNDYDNIGAGSERYCATSWNIVSPASTGTFDTGDSGYYHESDYTPTTAGNVTITVTFIKQIFDGQGSWADTAVTDTKQLNLTVDGTAATADAANNKVDPLMAYLNNNHPDFVIGVSGDRQFSPGTVSGEERYIPASFTYSDGTNTQTNSLGEAYKRIELWDGFNITPPDTGNFTVTTTFQKQTWDGTSWSDVAGVTDSKTITYDMLGGDTSDASLKVIMANGNMQVQRYNGTTSAFETQFYSDAGCFANVNGELYYIGNYYDIVGDYNKEATFISQTVNGNTITSKWLAGTLEVTQSVTLTNLMDQYVSVNYSLNNTGGTAITGIRFTKGADTYLSGGDNGAGIWKASTNTVGVVKTIGTGQQRMTLQGVTPPDSHTSQNFSRMDMEVIAGGALSGNIDVNPEIDNGYAMQWYNASLAAGATWSIDAIESFIVSPLSAIGETKRSDGSSVTMNFEVENKAGNPQNVTYSVTAPSGWTAVPARAGETIAAAGANPTKVTLPVTVTPASGAVNGNYSIVLNVEGLEEAQATGKVTIFNKTYTIDTIAGTGTVSSTMPTLPGDATTKEMSCPEGIAVDSSGNKYFADTDMNVIYKVDKSGNMSLFAGDVNGTIGYTGDGGPATAATLDTPFGLAFDSTGNLYIADSDNLAIRKVDTSGNISTVAIGEFKPIGVTVDSNGNIYLADPGRVFKVDNTGTAQLISGSFNNPKGMAADSKGNVYVADAGNAQVYKIDSSGTVTTVAGGGSISTDGVPAVDAELQSPVGVAVDADDNLYISDQGAGVIRIVDASSGNIFTIAGTGTQGYTGDGGAALAADISISFAAGLAVDNVGNVYFSDDENAIVRKLAPVVAPKPENPGSQGGSYSGGTSSNIETITVDVKEGNTDSTAAQISIKRTTESNGTKTDSVNYETEKATETVKQLLEAGKDTARIVIPDAEDKVSETKVTIPSKSVDILSDGKVNLQIDTEEAKINVANTTLADISTASDEDLYFRLVPVKDTVQKENTINRAMTVAIQLSGNADSTVSIVGNPITIETNMSSRAADITLPLKGVTIPSDLAQRAAFLEQLGIYIEHSDGTKELVQGQLVDYGNSVYGVSFHIEKFSTFTVVKTDAFLKSKDCNLIKVTQPTGAVIKGIAVRATVTNATRNLTVKAQVSDKATWKLYTDKSCTKVVKDNKVSLDAGNNVFYIKVTADDGKTSKIYKLTINREKPELQTGFNPLRLRAEGNTTSQKLSYIKVSEADGYVIYGAPCGLENHLVRIAEVSASTLSYNVKELKADTYYKYVVKAYQVINGKKVVVAVSNLVHSTTTSKTNANATKVTVSASVVVLKANATKQLTSKLVLPSGKKSEEHMDEIRYESSNTGIVTVSSTGKITAKAEGTCYIYAYAENGVYNKVKVTVK